MSTDILDHFGWHIRALQANRYWSRGLTGKGVKVAIIDSGIGYHSSLEVVGGVDLKNTSNPDYRNSEYLRAGTGLHHGTMCASVLASRPFIGSDGKTVCGIAPDVELYSVKVDDTVESLIDASNWIIANNIDIVNISIDFPPVLPQELTYAVGEMLYNGSIVFVALGNDGIDTSSLPYPEGIDDLVFVSGIEEGTGGLEYSRIFNYGSYLDFRAPATNIDTAYAPYTPEGIESSGSEYGFGGTSAATPLVAGVFANYKQAFPNKTNYELLTMVEDNAMKLSDQTEDRDILNGWGIPQPSPEILALPVIDPDLEPYSTTEPLIADIVTEGLIAYYNSKRGVDGNIWSNLAPDTAGLYNATINGSTTTSEGMYFDGVDDYVSINVGGAFGASNEYEMSIEFYMDIDDTGAVCDILSPAMGPRYSVYVDNSGSPRELNWDINRVIDGGIVTSFSTEYRKSHVVIATRGYWGRPIRTAYMYVDGELITQRGTGQSTGLAKWALRVGSFTGNNPKGIIDYIRIYKRVLTPAEVLQNFEVGQRIGLGDDAPVPTVPPTVSSLALSLYKVSSQIGFDVTTLSFKFDQDITEWRAVLLGVSHETGTVLDSGGATTADNEVFGVIDSSSLYQEGQNRVNIYGKNASGDWTPYSLG